MELGYIPSFCTACYREGRTGDRFMSLVKSGQIANCCQPNALMTLKEYLEDYASLDTRAKGEKVIQEELAKIPRDKTREIATKNLKEIEAGKSDSKDTKRTKKRTSQLADTSAWEVLFMILSFLLLHPQEVFAGPADHPVKQHEHGREH